MQVVVTRFRVVETVLSEPEKHGLRPLTKKEREAGGRKVYRHDVKYVWAGTDGVERKDSIGIFRETRAETIEEVRAEVAPHIRKKVEADLEAMKSNRPLSQVWELG